MRLSSLVNASVIQRGANAAILVTHRDHFDVATDAEAARLVASLVELAARLQGR